MSLITLLIIVIVLGLVFWLIRQLPMPKLFRTIILVIAVIIAVIYLLRFLPGVHLPGIHV